MTDNAMVKRKRRNQRGNLKPYIKWQTIQWLKEKGETKGEIEWRPMVPKGKCELNWMTDNTMVKRKRRDQRRIWKIEWRKIQWLKSEALHRMTENAMKMQWLKEKGETKGVNLKPYIEWQTIQWLKEKGETKGEIWSLTSNDRQYNG